MQRMSPKKLTLHRETLRELTSQQAAQVVGGITNLCTSDPARSCADTCFAICHGTRFC